MSLLSLDQFSASLLNLFFNLPCCKHLQECFDVVWFLGCRSL